MPFPRVQLLLFRHAETAWTQTIRPWLERSRAGLQRSTVVVPTRGQAQGLKQRCVLEQVPLLGVEFISPGLARQKWLPLAEVKPALGRELLLFELRRLIARRLAEAAPDSPERGLLKSLQSDAERAFDGFDELLQAGFGPGDFEQTPVGSVFAELAEQVDLLGYSIGSVQGRQAAAGPEGAARVEGRLLICGFSAEAWGEFFNVVAFARLFEDCTVLLPEPSFRGGPALDEKWIELWQDLTGTAALPLDAPEPPRSCETAAAGWGGEEADPAAPAEGSVRLVVGRTRQAEMDLVADEVVRLLAGAEPGRPPRIAVIFPSADAAHTRLGGALQERGVPFVDLLPRAGGPSLETQLLRSLVEFYRQGARLDEFLALWPLLRASGLVEVGLGGVRRLIENLFDERQTHALAPYLESLGERTSPEAREIHRVAGLLMPAWPDGWPLASALEAIERLGEPLLLTPPPSWAALREFAKRETAAVSREELCALLLSFLPEKSAVPGAASGFAPVTLTTRRRAEGLAWSHVFLVEANSGIWPVRGQANGWLSDEQRTLLNSRARHPLGLLLSDDRADIERRSYASLARDTDTCVVLSASLADEADPEAVLAPNSWLERLLWRMSGHGADLQKAFAACAVEPHRAAGRPPVAGGWLAVWHARRNPAAAFDEHFLSADPSRTAPARLSARQIEAGVLDPACWWFDGVLGVRRIDPGALVRQGARARGSQVHRVLSAALRGESREGEFFQKPDRAEAGRRLAEALARLRSLWPKDVFWDSVHGGLAREAETLLDNLYGLETPELAAAEVRLPEGLRLPLRDGYSIAVSGRLDVVCADRAEWGGSSVEIVDFKTGRDTMSAAAMASRGGALQLGIYLAAARALGATAGRVWMVKPAPGEVSCLGWDELDGALAALDRLAAALRTGCYGALTADRSVHGGTRLEWPLACTPIPASVLRAKYEATFGPLREGGAA